VVEARLDAAERNIAEAVTSDDSRRRDAASFFVLRTQPARSAEVGSHRASLPSISTSLLTFRRERLPSAGELLRMTLAPPPPTAMRSVRSSNTIRPRPNRTRTGIQPNHGKAGDSKGFRRSTMGWRHAAGTFKAAESEPVNLLSIMRR
jgi:hypothetical protein